MPAMEKEAIEAIIQNATVCRLAMCDGNRPYIVPMCFGYRDGTLFFHGALKSRKYDLLQQDPVVCFEFDILAEPLPAADPCDWDMRYQSVVGFGRAFMIEDRDAKRQALETIAAKYAPPPYRFTDRKIDSTGVFKVVIESMTGKASGFSRDPVQSESSSP
jgi:nitroimidazol reductase NimA-like FMN-containing flavoprotein (pyridoxamine 5'-phosphate oxidase superfamily)